MAEVEHILEIRNVIGEGPIWHSREGFLYWVNFIGEFQILRFSPRTRQLDVFATAMPVMALGIRKAGGFLAATACVPALRAGLSDAAPAHVRGAGFGAFNLASVVFGAAAAPLVTSAIATQFGDNYRTAFLIILPIAFLGAACLMLARRHIERDAARVFEAVALAMAAQQAADATWSGGPGARQDESEAGGAEGDT